MISGTKAPAKPRHNSAASKRSAVLGPIRAPFLAEGGAATLWSSPHEKYAIASVLLLSLTAPAFAAAEANQDAQDTSPNFHYDAKDHWAVMDTVGNCAVVDQKPSAYDISGLKTLGDKSGYSSLSAANNELKSEKSTCKGVIARS